MRRFPIVLGRSVRDEPANRSPRSQMKRTLAILLLEDSAADAILIVRELQRLPFPFECKRVETEADYLAALESKPDVILADYKLPRFGGHDALRLLQERKLDIPFIIISGMIGEDLAVGILKAGADDYLLKDRLGRLSSAVTHALEQRELGRKQRQAEA